MPIGTFGRPSASPYWMLALSCDSPRSLIVRPQKCVGRGTGVNRLKLGATACPARTVTSLASHNGCCWPSYGLPPPAAKAASVT